MPSNAPPSKAASFDECATTRRKFDCVLFWALDRFTREGMVPTIMHLQRLASYGVGFHSRPCKYALSSRTTTFDSRESWLCAQISKFLH